MSGPPFTVKALYEYTSDHEDDLTFSIGQIITVTAEEDDEWYFGEYADDSGTKKNGLFPRNFVERYEPPRPSRPSRPKREQPEPAAAPAPAPVSAPTPPAPAPITDNKPAIAAVAAAEQDAGRSSQTIPPPQPTPLETTTPNQPQPSPPAAAPSPLAGHTEGGPKTSSKPPPPVSEKPASFRDRIAAFNKPAAAPVTPFNPSKPAPSNTFVKKPFVAPPPSKNAYIPPPQPVQPPQKVYRREEDPEIQERAFQDQAAAERHLVINEGDGEEDDQPKPTSLKERIALLQKQQMEAAARHAAAAQKKEKPKKPPPKKKVEPEGQEQLVSASAGQELNLQRSNTSESAEIRAETTERQEEAQHAPRAGVVVPVIPSQPQPPRELTSDTNDADYSAAGDTEGADETSNSKEYLSDGHRERKQSELHAEAAQDQNDEDEEGVEEGTEEEEEMDPEVKRRMELRERMAKMSGGMGMMGMFGPPGGMPGMAAPGSFKKSKPPPPAEPERKSTDEQRPVPVMHAPPVPLMGLPGLHTKDIVTTPPDVESEDKGDLLTPIPTAEHQQPILGGGIESSQPAVSRAPPPPPCAPEESPTAIRPPERPRPVPPPPPQDRRVSLDQTREPAAMRMSPSLGEESDDELSGAPNTSEGGNPTSSGKEDESETGIPPMSPRPNEHRLSRAPPPPPPTVGPTIPAPALNRPPPPLPPTSPLSRKSTSDGRSGIPPPNHIPADDTEGEVTEYEGDYDTDIASGAKHKDALRAHVRDSSLEEGTITDDFTPQSPSSPPPARPPIPSTTAPRAVPPPPPSQPPSKQGRKSSDMPRAPPPPVLLPARGPYESAVDMADVEYDPFRYDTGPRPGESQTTVRAPAREFEQPDPYSASPPLDSAPSAPPPPLPERGAAAAPPPPPQSPPLQPTRSAPRQSLDMLRGQGGGRRSMDVTRPSMDQSYIATEVDLAENTLWWTQPNTPPPVFQNRRDLLFEIEESTFSKRGGKTFISKDVYVLFKDYSQTVISVKFDSRNPEDVVLEQRSEPPPQRLRQDQLEDAQAQFGLRISDAVASKQNTTIGDGSPQALVESMLAPFSDALLPVGTRAYGALVYANLANASVQQFDEIRAGDIVSFRNARFQGHRGTMHQKYSSEVGKPDHVGVVVDWDGTKKKIRAWEQGRESKKVKMESFKLGDLKSGECRVWRVVPRSWVGWDK